MRLKGAPRHDRGGMAHLEQGKATQARKKALPTKICCSHYRNMLATIDAADRDANSGSPNMAAYRTARAIVKDNLQAEREALASVRGMREELATT